MVKNLRYSDIYRNIARYLKKHEGKEGFKGTRAYLETLIDQPAKVEAIIMKMKSLGARCDYEVISIVKPQIKGGTFLVALD